MAAKKATARALTGLANDLSDEEFLALVDTQNRPDLKAWLAARIAFLIPLEDSEIPEKFRDRIAPWRKLAAELGYTGPIAWQVRAGFTLKEHAPLAGPCYEGFKYLHGWRLQNDAPTTNSIAFWIPALLAESTAKTVGEQTALLAATRLRLGLPDHHLASFGSAALLAGLILAYFRHCGKRVPANFLYARTDTLRAGGLRLGLGDFGEGGLDCGGWDDVGRSDDLGCFPLGVEAR